MMKTSIVTPAALAALTVAFAAQAAPTITGHGAPAATAFGADRVLWNQMGTDSGTAFVSQYFESSFESYDSFAADDFKVPKSRTWMVDEVDVVGVYFNGSGPARTEQVTFYKNTHGFPGAAIADYDAVGADNFGSFAITIPRTKIGKGVHWVSVAAHLDFTQGGEWGWENQTTVVLNPAVWENPGGGFGSCLTWCRQDGPGDEMFVLKGRQK